MSSHDILSRQTRRRSTRLAASLAIVGAALAVALPADATLRDANYWAERLEPGWHLLDGWSTYVVFARPNFQPTAWGTRIGWTRTEFHRRTPIGALSLTTKVEVDCKGFRRRELESRAYGERGLQGAEVSNSMTPTAWISPPQDGELLIEYACAETVAARLDPGIGFLFPIPGFRVAHKRDDLEPEHLCPEAWRKPRLKISGVVKLVGRLRDLSNTPYVAMTILPDRPVCLDGPGFSRDIIELWSTDRAIQNAVVAREGQRITVEGHLTGGLITSDSGQFFPLALFDPVLN